MIKTLSNAKPPKPGQGIPQAVARARLDSEFVREAFRRLERHHFCTGCIREGER